MKIYSAMYITLLYCLIITDIISAAQPKNVIIDVKLNGEKIEVATHGLTKDKAVICTTASQTVEQRESIAQASVATVQRTFAMIKPDAVQAMQTGRIITMIELNKFNISQMRKVQLTKDQAETFYAEHKDKSFFTKLVDYMTSGPVIMLVLEKTNAINDWRTLMGTTNPDQAQPGTLRLMFGTDKQRNAVHGSDSVTSAEREIQFFLGIK